MVSGESRNKREGKYYDKARIYTLKSSYSKHVRFGGYLFGNCVQSYNAFDVERMRTYEYNAQRRYAEN